MADYLLQVDPNPNLRPPSKHSYWQRKDDKLNSIENLSPQTPLYKLGSNHYNRPNPELKPHSNETFKAALSAMEEKLQQTQETDPIYNKLRHWVISMRRENYLYGDFEHPTRYSTNPIYSPEAELSLFNHIDLTNSFHIKQLYNNYNLVLLNIENNLELQQLNSTLILLEKRILCKSWARELLFFKRQGLTYPEYFPLMENPKRQPYCVNTLNKLYEKIAEMAEILQMEETCLKNPQPNHWHQCKVCGDFLLDIEFYWRKTNRHTCKMCLSKIGETEQNSNIKQLNFKERK